MSQSDITQSPIDTATLLQYAARAVSESRVPTAHVKRATAYLNGDHWQSGLEWVGPTLPANNALAPAFLAEIQRQFTPKNAVGEIVNRHIGAVMGRYPNIKLALKDATAEPTDEQKAEMKQYEGYLTAWLDHYRALTRFQKFARYLLLGAAQLRSYVPTGELDEHGQIPQADFQTSLKRIRLVAAEPGSAGFLEDEESGIRFAVYTGKTLQGLAVTEVSYVQPDGMTIMRRVEGALDAQGLVAGQDDTSDPLDLNGLPTITHVERELFITPSFLDNQRQINFAKTAIIRNAELAAVLERYGIGILPPGDWVEDRNAPGGLRYVPQEGWQPGGGQATFFNRDSAVDANGNVTNASGGQYGRFEPVDPKALIATKDDAYDDMLDEAGQTHISTKISAHASGAARQQATNDFQNSLYASATPLEWAIGQHLEMVLAWAAHLSGEPGKFRDYRVVVQCRLLANQPTAQDRAQTVAEYQAGLRAQEDAMSLIGVEDTDQAVQQIETEQAKKLAAGQQAASSLADLISPKAEPVKVAPADANA